MAIGIILEAGTGTRGMLLPGLILVKRKMPNRRIGMVRFPFANPTQFSSAIKSALSWVFQNTKRPRHIYLGFRPDVGETCRTAAASPAAG